MCGVQRREEASQMESEQPAPGSDDEGSAAEAPADAPDDRCEAQAEPCSAEAEALTAVQIETMRLPELKAQLEKRGKSTHGKKAQLVHALKTAAGISKDEEGSELEDGPIDDVMHEQSDQGDAASVGEAADRGSKHKVFGRVRGSKAVAKAQKQSGSADSKLVRGMSRMMKQARMPLC